MRAILKRSVPELLVAALFATMATLYTVYAIPADGLIEPRESFIALTLLGIAAVLFAHALFRLAGQAFRYMRERIDGSAAFVKSIQDFLPRQNNTNH